MRVHTFHFVEINRIVLLHRHSHRHSLSVSSLTFNGACVLICSFACRFTTQLLHSLHVCGFLFWCEALVHKQTNCNGPGDSRKNFETN